MCKPTINRHPEIANLVPPPNSRDPPKVARERSTMSVHSVNQLRSSGVSELSNTYTTIDQDTLYTNQTKLEDLFDYLFFYLRSAIITDLVMLIYTILHTVLLTV